MYKLIIADDEPLIREGLFQRNDWNKLGFEVIALLEDGSDVLEILETQHVDVVLTDICMYQVSGLELAKMIQEKYPLTKVVLISGYQDFGYARKAIHYGVYDYLLKPIDYENLQAVFTKIKEELDEIVYEQQLLCDLGGAEYSQVLEITRFVSDSVLGEGEESWVAYAHLKEVLRNAPSEVRGIINKKLLEVLKLKLESKNPELAEEFQKRLKTIKQTEETRADGESQLLVLFSWLHDELIAQDLVKQHSEKGDGCIQKACSYIKNHLGEDFTYRDVADFVHLSSRHFIRRFRTEMGESFTDYVFKIRMEGALRLLAEDGIAVEDVGHAVGYHDEKYFQAIFKKYTGYTLREYRRKVRGEKQ